MQPRRLRLQAALVLASTLVAAPATADFPEDLEGELRLFAPTPEPPLAALGPIGEGTFRLEAEAGGDIRFTPLRAELILPGGALRAVARDPFEIDYSEVPPALFGPIDWTFEWDAPPTIATPWLDPFPSTLEAFSWNFQMLLTALEAVGPPADGTDLDAEAGAIETYLPGVDGRFGCQRYVAGVGVVVLPGCRPCDPAEDGCGFEPVGPPTLLGDPVVSLIEMIQDASGLPVEEGCVDPTACIDLGWLTSALTFIEDIESPVWLWTLGGAFDVVQVSGSLAPYEGWLLYGLGPELDRVGGGGARGMVFLLVPPVGLVPPPLDTPLLRSVAPDGIVAGAYGSEAAESTCSGPDGDGDGMPDACDNCSALANGFDAPALGEQHDSDGDGFGNACDCDFDQDGGCGIGDFHLFLADFSSQTDGGAGTDMNGDGLVGVADFSLFLGGFVLGSPGPSASSPTSGATTSGADGCGLGVELALLLPGLTWLRRRRRDGAK